MRFIRFGDLSVNADDIVAVTTAAHPPRRWELRVYARHQGAGEWCSLEGDSEEWIKAAHDVLVNYLVHGEHNPYLMDLIGETDAFMESKKCQ